MIFGQNDAVSVNLCVCLSLRLRVYVSVCRFKFMNIWMGAVYAEMDFIHRLAISIIRTQLCSDLITSIIFWYYVTILYILIYFSELILSIFLSFHFSSFVFYSCIASSRTLTLTSLLLYLCRQGSECSLSLRLRLFYF